MVYTYPNNFKVSVIILTEIFLISGFLVKSVIFKACNTVQQNNDSVVNGPSQTSIYNKYKKNYQVSYLSVFEISKTENRTKHFETELV